MLLILTIIQVIIVIIVLFPIVLIIRQYVIFCYDYGFIAKHQEYVLNELKTNRTISKVSSLQNWNVRCIMSSLFCVTSALNPVETVWVGLIINVSCVHCKYKNEILHLVPSILKTFCGQKFTWRKCCVRFLTLKSHHN